MEFDSLRQLAIKQFKRDRDSFKEILAELCAGSAEFIREEGINSSNYERFKDWDTQSDVVFEMICQFDTAILFLYADELQERFKQKWNTQSQQISKESSEKHSVLYWRKEILKRFMTLTLSESKFSSHLIWSRGWFVPSIAHGEKACGQAGTL